LLLAGGQQTSDQGPIVIGGGGDGGGDPGSGDGGSGGTPIGPALLLSLPPNTDTTQSILQQFFGELSYVEAQHNEYTGSSYDDDAGANYAPYPEGYLSVPSHDPAANAPYWNNWDGDTDPEFFGAIRAYELTHGLVSVGGSSALHAVALQLTGQNTTSVFVDGRYYIGTFHPGNAPGDVSGQPENNITVQGIHDGYWTFSLDNSGIAQSGLVGAGLWSYANFAGAASPLAHNSSAPTELTPAEKQAALDLLAGNSKFFDFKLNGVDIAPAILDAIKKDTIAFTDDFLPGRALTDTPHHTIYLSSSFKSDPVGLALVLAHEGLHQAMWNIFGPHGDSIYEETLGKLVSAYAMSGLTTQQLNVLKTDTITYNDINNVKTLSDQGNFVGIMNYIRPLYGAISDYPLDPIYNVLKGSFHDTRG